MSSIRSDDNRYEGMSDRIVIGVWGNQKKGKTHFALTAPEPIFLFDFDHGIEGVADKFDKEIYQAVYYVPEEPSYNQQRNILDKFKSEYHATRREESEGTIVLDSFTQIWNLISAVKIEEVKETRKKKEIYPFDYGDANDMAEGFVDKIYDCGLNLVVTERAKKSYDNSGNWTGSYEPRGYKGIPYLMQVFGRVQKEGDRRVYTITDCRFDDTLEGQNIYDPTVEKVKSIVMEELE